MAAPEFLYAAVVLGLRLTTDLPTEGWASIAVIVLALGGVQLVVTGTLGEYVWRALDLANGRSLHIVASVTNPVGRGPVQHSHTDVSAIGTST